VVLGGLVLGFRHNTTRTKLLRALRRLPVLRTLTMFQKTTLFCRNLDVLLAAGVPLTTTLRILSDIMASIEDGAVWAVVVDYVRQGGKLSDGLGRANALPPMAVRMLRLGEETGQLAVLAGRVADFYETKLQRSLDRVVAL